MQGHTLYYRGHIIYCENYTYWYDDDATKYPSLNLVMAKINEIEDLKDLAALGAANFSDN